jgi:hypothetical protein
MVDPDIKLLLWLLVLSVLAATGWYFRDALLPQPPAPVAEVTTVVAAPETVDSGPRHPILATEIDTLSDRTSVPLPALDDSDGFFLLEIGAVLGTDIESLFLREGVIDRLVATVDNLPRQQVSNKIRPVRNLAQVFAADVSLEKDRPFILGPLNFQRYDGLVAHIEAADLDAIVDMYRRYYPLFQKSFERLGYPNAYFNDRFIEVIDHLLETPEPAEPLTLLRPNVLYEFADPEFERLSSGQKLLLRMGEDHALVIKQVLRLLRSRIAGGND